VYIYNKTNFSSIGSLSVRNTSGSVTDLAIYSLENQPPTDSKQSGRIGIVE